MSEMRRRAAHLGLAEESGFTEFLEQEFAESPLSTFYGLRAARRFPGGITFIVEGHLKSLSGGGITMAVTVGVYVNGRGTYSPWQLFRNKWNRETWQDDWSFYYDEITNVVVDEAIVLVTVKSKAGESAEFHFDLTEPRWIR